MIETVVLLVVGAFRVRLGAYRLTDVLGGYALGGVAGTAPRAVPVGRRRR